MTTGSKAIAMPYTYLDDCIVVESEMVRVISCMEKSLGSRWKYECYFQGLDCEHT